LVQILGLNIKDEDMLKIDISRFSIVYSSLISCLCLFPLIVKKDINFLIKINTLGVYSMILIIGFIIFVFFTSLLDTDYDFQYILNQKESKLRHLYLYGTDISKLSGMLSLGFFSHSIILPIMKNNRYQENNRRDLFLGYLMVAVTYIFLGIGGYIGFTGAKYDPKLFGSVRKKY
jgi:sodium-coupled neutral amino acid transporter 9